MKTVKHSRALSRRTLLRGFASAGALAASACLGPGRAIAQPGNLRKRAIPATDEKIPVIGMGSWLTFNVGPVKKLRDARVKVLQTFFDMGGGMVDSSPMYGSSEEVIGYCLERIANDQKLFSATKVWTYGETRGIGQMEDSERLWGEKQFDLMQIHNLLDWETHIETLKEWKASGRVRYIGMTTSHGRRHDELASVMKSQPLDFVQFTYNILDREAEERLLPLAADQGLGVIINRPFRRGALFDLFERHPLPEWASEFDCANWAQFFLKFIVSHPAVTCAIPATTRADHMTENMGALTGKLPDAKMRRRMIAYVEGL
jgi:diketogulonate reductase-like aldo/keto reductase